jgi:hypothetical protein
MDPAKVAFLWQQQRLGEQQLIETTIWDLWNEGSKWYVILRSRTRSNPRSADNSYETLEIDGATGEVVPRDGSLATYVSKDFLEFRYTAFACRYCFHKDPEFQDFNERFDEAAKFLQDNDHANHLEGASMIVELVEEGVGVIGPSSKTEWRGRSGSRYGACPEDGCGFTRVLWDFLMFRYTTFGFGWRLRKEPKYRYYERRFDEAARLLQTDDHGRRVEGASILVNLVEDGAGVIGPTPRTELQGHAVYDIEISTGFRN